MLYQENKDRGLLVVGVAGTQIFGADDTQTLMNFVEQTGVTFPIVRNEGSEDQFQWPPGSAPYPRTAILDAAGSVVYLASEHDQGAVEGVIAGQWE